jgi:hypothetical protein
MCAAVVALFCIVGCVQRRMTIRSNPPGAYVYIDNYPIGVTPVATDFVYYGKRQFRLVADGYETLTVDQKVRAPWYQWFGIDFISENVIPYNIRDEQTLNFQLVPQQIPSIPELTARGEELRTSTQAQRYVAPVPVAPPQQPLPSTYGGPPGGPPASVAPPGAMPPVGPPGTRVPPPTTGQPIYTMPPPSAPGVNAPPPAYAPPQAYGPPPGSMPPPGAIPPPQQLSP